MTVDEHTVGDFDIGVMAEGQALGCIGADFMFDAKALRLSVVAECRETFSIKAGIEWVLPTAFALFLANRYVGTLLQEAAKDHYPLIKAAVLKVVRRTTGKDREIRTRVVTTSAAKSHEADPATLSVWFILRDARRAVFRFDHALPPDALAAAVDALFDLVIAHAVSDKQEDVLSRSPACMRSSWAPVIMRFDCETNCWRSWTLDRQGLEH